jgi:hypothetical protein
VTPVGSGDARDLERFGERDNRGVDKAKIETCELLVDLRDPPVGLPRQIRDEVVPFRDLPS